MSSKVEQKRRNPGSQYEKKARVLRWAQKAKKHLSNNEAHLAQRYIEQALKDQPQSTRLQILYAKVFAKLGSMDQAKEAVIKAYELAQRHPERYKEYLRFLNRELSEWPELCDIFHNAVKNVLDRGKLESVLKDAEALYKERNFKAALNKFLILLEAKFQDSYVVKRIADTLEQQKNVQKTNYFNRFLRGELSRKDLITLLVEEDCSSQSVLYVSHDHPKHSVDDLIREIEEEIDKEEHLTPEKISDTIRDCLGLLEKQVGDDAKSRIDVAIALFEMGLDEAACKELESISSKDVHYVEAQCLLGEFLYKMKQFQQAIKVFDGIIYGQRFTLEQEKFARYYRGILYKETGNLFLAWNEMVQVERLDPNYRDLRRLKNEIQEVIQVEPSIRRK